MTTTSKSKPVETLRDGAMKATIWANPTEQGTFYRVHFTRSWKDAEGNFRDADNFSGTELLRIARLANLAYDRNAALRSADRKPPIA